MFGCRDNMMMRRQCEYYDDRLEANKTIKGTGGGKEDDLDRFSSSDDLIRNQIDFEAFGRHNIGVRRAPIACATALLMN
jgi:hypothetical protein